MSRNNERRYQSAKEAAEKQDSGSFFPYLKLPAGAQLFKLKEGHMLIDILPYEVGKGNPFAEKGMLYWERTFWTHRNVGANSESYLCSRKTFNKPCPVCEYRAKLQKQADDDNEDEIKSLSPSQRQLLNLIDLKFPDKGVQVFNTSYHLFGKKLNAEILSAEEDDGWEKFFYLEGGMSLKLGVGEGTFAGHSFTQVDTMHFKPRRTEYDEDMLEKAHPLDELLLETPYDKLKAILLQTDADEDEDDEDEPKSKRKSSDDDDEDEPKPKRLQAGSKGEEEEDEDRPAKKKSRDEDEDDDDEPKKKKSKSEEEEDEEDDDWEAERAKGKKKSKDDEDEDEDEPKKKSKSDEDEDDDEEESAAKKKKLKDEDDWDDFDEKPKKKSKKDEDDEDDEDEDEPKSRRKARDEDEDDDEEKPRIKTKDQEDEEDEEEDRPKKKSRR